MAGAAGLKSDDVATVGDIHVSKAQFDALIAQAKRSYASQTPPKTFPKQGTADYETIKGQAVSLLVQQAEREEKATSMGIKISDADIQKRLDEVKKQYFSGSETKYQSQLKKQGLTDAQVRNDIRQQLISEALFAKVTKDTKVSDSAVHTYYVAHKSLYTQLPTARRAAHPRRRSKPLAQTIYNQLRAGNDKTWCTLAKKYSQDPSSKNNCGKLTVPKGQTVPEFDKVAFSTAAKVIHVPVHNAQYGVVRDRAALRGQAEVLDPGEQGRCDDPAAAAAAGQEPGHDGLGRVADEELLLGLEDQVPGRVHAEPGPVRVDDQRDDDLDSVSCLSRKRSSSSRS